MKPTSRTIDPNAPISAPKPHGAKRSDGRRSRRDSKSTPRSTEEARSSSRTRNRSRSQERKHTASSREFWGNSQKNMESLFQLANKRHETHERRKSEGTSTSASRSSRRKLERGKEPFHGSIGNDSVLSRPHNDTDPPPAAGSTGEGWKCDKCSNLNMEEGEVCIQCLSMRPRQHWTCVVCGERNKNHDKVCPKCSAEVFYLASKNRNREQNLSPRSNMINMFLAQLARAQSHNQANEREREGGYPEKAPKVPLVDPNKTKKSLLVKPFGPFGDVTCDLGHYLVHFTSQSNQCDSCFKQGTMYSCEPCEYNLCLKCVKEESQGRKTVFSDISSMSSWSDSESAPTSAAWTKHMQDETQSTCSETNKLNNGASSSETGSRSKRKSKAEEKKKKARKKYRERRRICKQQRDEGNAKGYLAQDSTIDAKYRDQYRIACLANSRNSSVSPCLYSRELPDPKLCCRDLLVTECGDPRADGEYAQYNHIYRNVHNSQVIIYWDADTKTYYHLYCHSSMDSMEDINEMLLDREKNSVTMYKNVTRSTMMPLTIPNEGWETVDEKFGNIGKYVVTSIRIKKIIKNLRWMEIKDLYNTVYLSLQLTPKEVIWNILLYAGISNVWNWATTCKLLASDLSDPHSHIWNELSLTQRYQDTDGRGVVERRRFAFCGRHPVEESTDHVYESPKEMCRDENRHNAWTSLSNWHRPAFAFRHNNVRCGVIANMSLDSKRNYLVLHIIHNLQTESSKHRISPFGGAIAKYSVNSTKRGPIFTGEVAYPVREEVVYERMRERHVLVYFSVKNETKKKRWSTSCITNFLTPFKQKPFSWQRKMSYYYIHRQDGFRKRSDEYHLTNGPYVPVMLFFIMDLPNWTLRRNTSSLEEYFNKHVTYRSKIDTFASLPPDPK